MQRKILHLLDQLGRAWCYYMHEEITWPVNGHYRCRSCLREWPVPWESPAQVPSRAVEAVDAPNSYAARCEQPAAA